MSPIAQLTRTVRNLINRYRRNRKRILNRRWHGKLRRSDDRKARIDEQKWIKDCIQRCVCEPPHPCPCDSVLCGMWCEQRGVGFDEEDEVEL